MGIQKRGNTYRVQKMFNGKRYSVTFDHKPKEQEIIKAFANVSEKTHYGKKNFEQAAFEYIEMKKNILSPRTIKEYKDTPKRFSKVFNETLIDDITQAHIQNEINILSVGKSPKTIRNYHAFISAVLKVFRPDLIINTTLPQKVKNEPYIPSDDEVNNILEYVKNKRPNYYVCIVLATYGLRRSEIIAITGDDVEGNILHINKAMVLNEDKKWVVKNTKTTESTRDIRIPQEIADKIKEDGYAFKGYPNDIYKILQTACKTLGIQTFSLHKLRHYFATKLLSENVDMTTVMSMGGWQSSQVLQKHYAHALESKKQNAFDILDKTLKV